jgi:hypothetical protein
MLLRDFTCAGQTLWKSRRRALQGVEAGDPAAFLTMIPVFLLVATAAFRLPGPRAGALDPTVALRQE